MKGIIFHKINDFLMPEYFSRGHSWNMNQSFDPPPPQLGDTQGIHF